MDSFQSENKDQAPSQNIVADQRYVEPKEVADPGKIRLGGAFRLPSSK